MARRHQAPCDHTSVRVDTSTTTKQSTTKTTISHSSEGREYGGRVPRGIRPVRS